MAGPLDTNRFQGDLGNAALVPEKTYGPPISGTWMAGQEHFDSYDGQWLCVVGGTPGTWIRINESPGAAGGADFERTITTGEAIAKFDIVTESGYKFDAKNLNHMSNFVGMASHNQALVPGSLVIWTPGSEIVNPGWAWTPNLPLYVDPDVPGGMTHDAPDGGPVGEALGWVEGRLQVAISVSSTSVVLVERDPVWFPNMGLPM